MKNNGFIIKNGILIKYMGMATKVVIPNTVTSIGKNAFFEHKNLVSVALPQGITEIQEGSFCACEKLENVNIPSTVTTIADYAFCHCESLANIKIPENVTTIGNYAFNCCWKLEKIIIPNSVSYIGRKAFGHCRTLTNIEITNSVTAIKPFAFHSLTEVIFLKNEISIGECVFTQCEELSSIIFRGTKAQWLTASKSGILGNGISDCIVNCTDGKLDICGNEVFE